LIWCTFDTLQNLTPLSVYLSFNLKIPKQKQLLLINKFKCSEEKVLMKENLNRKRSNMHDTLFLASEEIIFDNDLNYFRIALPDGNEFSVTIDRFLDIF